MRKKIGILLIIIITLLVSAYLILTTNISLFLIVTDLTKNEAEIIANQIIFEKLTLYIIAFITLTIINYFILKRINFIANSALKSIAFSILIFIILSLVIYNLKLKFIDRNGVLDDLEIVMLMTT